MPLPLLTVFCSTCLNGCVVMCVGEHPVQFRVVDSHTGRPLEGVEVTRHSGTNLPGVLVLSFAKEGTFTQGRTAADGSLRVGSLCNTQDHQYTFHKEGYRDASAKRSSIGGRVNEVLVELPPDNLFGERLRWKHVPAGKTVEVTMSREPVTPIPYVPVWRRIEQAPALMQRLADEGFRRSSAPEHLADRHVERQIYVNQFGDYRFVRVHLTRRPFGYACEWIEISGLNEPSERLYEVEGAPNLPVDPTKLPYWSIHSDW